jgi:hypothetical protein
MFLREPVLNIGGRERRVGGKLDSAELRAKFTRGQALSSLKIYLGSSQRFVRIERIYFLHESFGCSIFQPDKVA